MEDELRINAEKYLKSKLDASGFSITKYTFDRRYAGSQIVFSSAGYWLSLVYDRGQIFADVGHADQPVEIIFFDLWYVIAFLKHDFPRDYSGSTEEQVKRIAQALLTYWDEIFNDGLLVDKATALHDYIEQEQRSRWGNLTNQS